MLFSLLNFGCTEVISAELNKESFVLRHGLSSLSQAEEGEFLNTYLLPDGKYELETVHFKKGKFVVIKRESASLEELNKLRSKQTKKANLVYENAVEFTEKKENIDIYTNWIAFDLGQGNTADVSLKLENYMLSSKIDLNNNHIEIPGGMVSDIKYIKQSDKQYMLAYIIFCGASACSSELIAIEYK